MKNVEKLPFLPLVLVKSLSCSHIPTVFYSSKNRFYFVGKTLHAIRYSGGEKSTTSVPDGSIIIRAR